jgi:hypothetical protein
MEKRKGKYKMGLTICKNCGNEFEKPLTEIRRNEKLNRPNFCSRTCVGKNNVKNFGDNKFDITKFGGKRCGDEHTKFRYHFRNIKKRNKDVNITIDDLKEQWEKQNGICEFTGIKLILSSYSKIYKNPIYAASLDRIDNSKGYIIGNIRWIARSINLMKNDMSDDMVNELIDLIIEHKKGSHVGTF